MSKQANRRDLHVNVENIGGISQTEVKLTHGVTILTGRNATNRTSFLQAIIAALGGEASTLKGDADAGKVELTIGDKSYRRVLSRVNGTVAFSGEPYASDPQKAELFAFLLEDNQARQSIIRQGDLRELIMEPVDTDEIQAEIDRLKQERSELRDELNRLKSLREKLPELKEERSRLENRFSEKEVELQTKREELEDLDGTVGETREQKQELEKRVTELQETNSELERVEQRIETQQQSIEASKADMQDLEEELASLPEAPTGEISELDAEIDRLRDHKSSVEETVNQLQKLLKFNREMVEGDRPEFLNNLFSGGETTASGSVTDKLLDDQITCWTCGSEVDVDRIEETIEDMESFRQEKTQERNSITSEIDDLIEQRDTYERQQRDRDRIEQQLDEIEAEIDDRKTTIDELGDKRKELKERATKLESDVDALESEAQSEVLNVHKEVNQLEFERDSLKDDLEDVQDEIESIEETVEQKAELKDEIESINEALQEQRTKIERLEKEAVEAFNEHMEMLLDTLEYENIERIWIERTEQQVREGRRKVKRSQFDLHVVRSTDNGTVYEDTVAHLSESEREVTGLVFALAGYLVHDVHEEMPFMILDSLEALDSERISALVDYFAEFASYLVVALLPEDAAALDDQYQRVTEI